MCYHGGMTEFEITQYIENHISVYGRSGLRIPWLFKPELPTLEPMIRDLPALGLRFVMTPEAYAVGEVSHQRGEPVPIATERDILDVLQARRQEMGFTSITEIAPLLGMDRSYYSRIESGQYQMSLRMLLRICRMLWIDVKVEPINEDPK